jgi:hypothetical protein
MTLGYQRPRRFDMWDVLLGLVVLGIVFVVIASSRHH